MGAGHLHYVRKTIAEVSGCTSSCFQTLSDREQTVLRRVAEGYNGADAIEAGILG
jgi:FixJ family two-component response regulator